MAKVNLQIKGVPKLLKKFEKLGDDAIKVAEEVTQINARDIEATAKSLAPKDTGLLAGSINSSEVDKLTWRVSTNVKYAPFMEFGTGGLVSVPNELRELASLFKGRGVKKIDLRPQPFMWPAFVLGRQQYVKDLENQLERLTNKNN